MSYKSILLDITPLPSKTNLQLKKSCYMITVKMFGSRQLMQAHPPQIHCLPAEYFPAKQRNVQSENPPTVHDRTEMGDAFMLLRIMNSYRKINDFYTCPCAADDYFCFIIITQS